MMNRVPVAHSCNLSYLGGWHWFLFFFFFFLIFVFFLVVE
jgi:hypothetical protein